MLGSSHAHSIMATEREHTWPDKCTVTVIAPYRISLFRYGYSQPSYGCSSSPRRSDLSDPAGMEPTPLLRVDLVVLFMYFTHTVERQLT